MPIIQPDTSEAVNMGPIEPGTYRAKIVDVPYQLSKKNNPMIVPKFEISVGDEKPRVRQAFLVISGPGSFNFDQLLRACHFDELADQYKDPSVPNPDFDTDTLVGQELQVVIDSRLDDGNNLRDDIKGFLKA